MSFPSEANVREIIAICAKVRRRDGFKYDLDAVVTSTLRRFTEPHPKPLQLKSEYIARSVDIMEEELERHRSAA